MSAPHSYRESLDYLFGLQFFGIKLGLDNIRGLLARVDNPQDHLRIIHIAGTNGKGSTAAALAAAFHAAGISAGLYTSPHLHDFSERIRIDTVQIDQDEIVALIEELRPHAEELKATFFEFTTAMALLSFKRHGVEWAILETGMGGRLDATNAVTPELCVLTSIGLDHTAYLGDSLAAVAAEKAGIFKPGVPVVSVMQQPEAQAVVSTQAAACSASLILEGRDYRWHSHNGGFDLSFEGWQLDGLVPRLKGRHQFNNLALAAAALLHLKKTGLAIDPAAVRQGIEQVCWPGRLEELPGRILVDGAHNPAGAECLAAYLKQEQLSGLHVVLGCKADKHGEGVLTALLPFVERLYVAPPPVDEAFDPATLVALARRHGIAAEACSDVEAALTAARKNRGAEDYILAAGSLFLVAAVRELVLPDTDTLNIV